MKRIRVYISLNYGRHGQDDVYKDYEGDAFYITDGVLSISSADGYTSRSFAYGCWEMVEFAPDKEEDHNGDGFAGPED